MFMLKALLALGAVASSTAHFTIPNDDQDMSGLVVNAVPWVKRVEYMRKVKRPGLSSFSADLGYSDITLGKRGFVSPEWTVTIPRVENSQCQ